MYGQAIGLIGKMTSSYISGKKQRKYDKAVNTQNEKIWDDMLSQVRDQISIAYNRTQIGISEINQDRLAKKMAARKAGIKAKGTASTKAAQMGIAGRRASRDVTIDISREEADAVSDTEIDTEIAMINTVNKFNDAAKSAINNLNAQSPVDTRVTSSMDVLVGTIGTGLSYYNGLSDAQKSDLKSGFNFSTTKDIGSNIETAPQITQTNQFEGYT